MGSRTLVGGTSYKQIQRGNTKVKGTDYVINRGKTLASATVRTINLVTMPIGTEYSWKSAGTYTWTCEQTGSYTAEIYGGGGGGSGKYSDGSVTGSPAGTNGRVADCYGGGGGGSGNSSTITLTAGVKYTITVGKGGVAGVSVVEYVMTSSGQASTSTYTTTEITAAGTGETSSIKNGSTTVASCAGGGGGLVGYTANGGSKSGNLSSKGGNGSGGITDSALNSLVESLSGDSSGGKGNTSKPSQTYGNGGNGATTATSTEHPGAYITRTTYTGNAGSDGAIILTLKSY